MLVFTRKRDEAIMIGDGVEIRVLRVGKDGVRIGVSAPASVSVHRREVYDQICEENRIAARAVSGGEGLAAQLRRRLDPASSGAAASGEAPVAGEPPMTGESRAAGNRR
jgi:carbon storage regulator